jgi:uncharacterized protein
MQTYCWEDWEPQIQLFLATQMQGDVAHDEAHIRRVVASATVLAGAEAADLAIVLPAAWLHDCVNVPKNSAQRQLASQLSARVATEFLSQIGYPAALLPHIGHCIAAHSFSANIPPATIEARVVQDADRLDSLGAIGIARCLMHGGAVGRQLYHTDDPFVVNRLADDQTYTVDHFFIKLLRLVGTMQTNAGRREAQARTAFMQTYLDQLRDEIG